MTRAVAKYARFSVPPSRSDWVRRRRLVAWLESAGDLPGWVLAGAGYGKSTLLAQLANADPRAAAWVRLSKMHNDPTVLISDLTLAVESVQPSRVGSPKRRANLTARDVLADASESFLLVLDDAHNIAEEESLEVLRLLTDQIPPGSRLVFAARTEPALGLPRLRANRALVELHATDLAMTVPEARALMRLVGINVDTAVCKFLVERTEGWPAGLYLAALRLRGEEDQEAAAWAFAGDDRNVVEYLQDEWIHALPRKTVDFLLQTSILDRLSGPLCDAVRERRDSTHVLETIHDSNLLLVPLDQNREWYHCHNLLRDMLQSELHRSNPELERVLHERASVWFEAHGALDAAVHHAREAHDDDRVTRLIWAAVPAHLSSGRGRILATLLDPSSRTDIAKRPPLVVASAIQALAQGDWGEFKYWASVAALAPPDQELPDGTPLRCVTALLHATLGENGMSQVRDDALLAYRLDRPESPWRSIACLLEGRASRLLGQAEHARARLREGVVIGRTLARGVEAQCLAQLAILETDDDQWIEAAELAAEAMNLVMSLALDDQPVMAMVFAVSSLVHARAGPMSTAAAEAKHAVFLSSMPSDAGAWFAAETRLLAARTYLHLGDVTLARGLLREARRMLNRTPDVDMLVDSIEKALVRADSLQAPLGVLATPLTPAEIRVLRFLPTHLTFPAIADELFVSRNTVKTQAISIYRKLGVSSRKPAVDAARSLGFLEP